VHELRASVLTGIDMNWLKQAVSSVEAKLQETGVTQRLADVSEKIGPAASVASSNARSLMSSLSTTIEASLSAAPNPKALLNGNDLCRNTRDLNTGTLA
jgi:hypothetical protein